MKHPDRPPPDHDHWLVRPSTIRGLWICGSLILAGLVALDLVIEHKPHFGIDGSIGFGAWFGFAACVAMVLFAKALGVLLKRPDTYYDH
jgi:drug/metabolite transporter (DMT)-like permease